VTYRRRVTYQNVGVGRYVLPFGQTGLASWHVERPLAKLWLPEEGRNSSLNFGVEWIGKWNPSHALSQTPFVKSLGLPCPWDQFN
jgi:hypothetical protein